MPDTVDKWGWTCGFYPASDRGVKDTGTGAFETAWRTILPRCTDDDFVSYRRQQAWNQWKQKMWATGSKLPTQCADGRSTCYCGEPVDMAGVDHHVYAAHLGDAAFI